MYQTALWHHTTVDDAGDAQAPWCYAGPAACAPPPRRRPTPAVVPWRVSAEAALAPQSRRRRRFVVVAVGLETVVNVVVQLGSAGHTAAAACAAPSIPLLLRAPRRPSILLQPQCRIQEDSCHSTAAARPLCRRRRRRAIGAACKLATRPTVEKNMPSYHLPICLRAARCSAARL